MLIVLGGRPATGKTTIARLLSGRLRATHLRLDTIEQALRSSGTLRADVGAAGYLVAYALAEDMLRLGQVVIADSVNPVEATRAAWRAVAARAGVQIMEVELIRSDPTDHRHHLETRQPDIAGLTLPSWDDVVARTYEAWDRPMLSSTPRDERWSRASPKSSLRCSGIKE
ncbi:MAG: AAA family ATPase [Pseudomonadota bacterium]